jgi:RNA polymerase sigma factor (sigma-70 family)
MGADRKDQAAGPGDNELIRESLGGSQEALEGLIARHQAWIYNIAFKMVMNHDDASDATQEVLIKIMTSLATYDPAKAAFRTWAYRITANHVLSMKRSAFESRFSDLDEYFTMIRNIPDDRSFAHPDSDVLLEELRISCMTGMLICLNRRERLAFILGGIFGVPDTVGGEIMEVSSGNFRTILSRARRKVQSHMKGHCGHVDPANPCRCSNKIRFFLEKGAIRPDALNYYRGSSATIREAMCERYDDFKDTYYDRFYNIYKNDPFYDPPDMVRWLRDIVKQEQFRDIFNIHHNGSIQ